MNITVYLGAGSGTPALQKAARDLGLWIGRTGSTLVYGGSRTGLMGELAFGALDAGGRVVGVEPAMFMEKELQLDAIQELIVTEDFAQRKAKMIQLGDAFIAFPGGTGTLEEISEIMSALSLGLMDHPCILYDLNGYYTGLKLLLEQMIEAGLSTKERQKKICFAKDLAQIAEILGLPAPGSLPAVDTCHRL